MAKTSGHIKRAKVGSVEEHNERKREYLERLKAAGHPLHYFPSLTANNKHWVNEEKHYKGKTCEQIFTVQQRWYERKKKQKPQLKDRTYIDKNGREKVRAGWSPIREMVVVIKPDTKLEDFKPVMEWFRKNKVTPIRLDLHFDEGHDSRKTGERIINNHAHLVLDWMDWQTATTAKLGPKKMQQLQDVLADALGMERGIIRDETGASHIDQGSYRAIAEARENIEIHEENLRAREEKMRIEADKAAIDKAKELSQKELNATNTALQEARDELEVVTSQKEKAAKDAKAAIWSAAGSVGQSVAGMFGQSGKDKVIKDQAQQIEALQRELKAERDNHASALRKAVQNAQKPFVEFLSRIASIVGWHPTTITANNAEEAARRVKDVVESRDTWRRSSQKAEEQLKEIKRSQEPTQVVTLKR